MIISDPRHTECSNFTKQDGSNVYAIVKTICLPSYHHNGLVETCTWAHDLRLHIVGTNKPKTAQQARQEA